MNSTHLRIVGATDVGQKRTTNEDYLIVDDDLNILVLADGMGGHNAGEIASQMVASCVMDHLSLWLRKSKSNTINKSLKRAIARFINLANQQVLQVANLDAFKRGMGTTLVVGVCYRGKLTVAHVGDSRAYLFRKGQLTQLTKDHSKVQELIDAGILLKEHAHTSRFNNILTRAVGVQDQVEATYLEIALEEGDKVMFCSDGLTNMVCDNSIEDIFLANHSMALILQHLVGMANQSGGSDNITVALGAYEQLVS
jgi:serine/threonine protein phosphatase PrpC